MDPVDDEGADGDRDGHPGTDGDVAQRTDFPEVRACQRFCGGVDGRDGDAAGLSLCHQVGHRLGGELCRDRGVEFCRGAVTRGDGVELGAGELFRLPHPGPHAAPLPGGQQTDPDVSVPAAEYRVDLLIARPAAPQLGGRFQPDRRLALGPERWIERLYDSLEPREINEIPLAAT